VNTSRLLAFTLGTLSAIGGFIDIGDLVADAQVGARFGLRLGWVTLVSVIGIMCFAEMAGRIAVNRAALRRVPSLTPEADDILNVLADNEQRHVEALRQALQDIGAQPSEPPHFDFGDAVADQEAFLEVAQKLEDVGVYAYNGAIPNVTSEPLVTLLAATVQVEGRHAAAIRQLRGFPIVQSAFDVGVGGERAFRAVDHLILS